MAQRVNVRRLALFALTVALLVAGVLLTSQPAQADMSGGKIRFRNGYIILKFDHTGSAVHRRAYISSDFTALGYHANLIYAHYLLEDNQLYRFAGSTVSEWTWTPIASVSYVVDGAKVKWKVDEALIDRACPYGLHVVFEVEKSRDTKTMLPIYKFDNNCALPTSTPTQTYTPSPTPLLTYTPTPPSTHTPTSTPEKPATATNTLTRTPSPSNPTDIPTYGPSNTPTNTYTATAAGPTATPSNTATSTPTVPTDTPSNTATPSNTPLPTSTGPTPTFTPLTFTPTQCGGGECPLPPL
ncbi:MAG: hypothetical protein IPM16_21000 [Chloroflexi bacterium]|nr:hypothetical protein [Chloroflexota bacterium]